jgi:hypothetical protein
MAQMIGTTLHGEKVHALKRTVHYPPWRTLCGLQPFVVDGQGTVRDTLVTCVRCLGLVVE